MALTVKKELYRNSAVTAKYLCDCMVQWVEIHLESAVGHCESSPSLLLVAQIRGAQWAACTWLSEDPLILTWGQNEELPMEVQESLICRLLRDRWDLGNGGWGC